MISDTGDQYRQLVRSAPGGAVFWMRSMMLRQIHLIVVQPRIPIGLLGIAVPAVLGARPIANLALVRHAVSGSAGLLEEIFHQINRIVQEISVIGADVKMKLALQLRPQRRPVPLQNRIQVVVLAPVLSRFVIDRPGPACRRSLADSRPRRLENKPPARCRTARQTGHDRPTPLHTRCCRASR